MKLTGHDNWADWDFLLHATLREKEADVYLTATPGASADPKIKKKADVAYLTLVLNVDRSILKLIRR